MTTDASESSTPSLPEDIIQSWTLHFRGDYVDQAGQLVFKPFLKATTTYTSWSDLSPRAVGPDGRPLFDEDPAQEPVLTILDSGEKPHNLDGTERGNPVTLEAPWVVFNRSGYLVDVDLDLISPVTMNTRVIGTTENVAIRATIRTVKTFEPGDRKSAYKYEKLRRAIRVRELPLPAAPGPADEIDGSSYPHIQPIVYMAQGADGYLLLAELGNEAGLRRLLFAIKTADKQELVVTHPYSVFFLPEYTIRVQQDGDLFTEGKSYFEFWVNNLPLDIHPLSSTRFEFNQDVTQVGIGYCPAGIISDTELFFQGGIAEIIVDPHGHCGC